MFCGIFKNFKKNFLYLLPFFIGIDVGAILFGNILTFLFTNYEVSTKLLFIGLIIGSIPALLKETHNKYKKGFRLHYLLFTITSFFVGLLLVLCENLFFSTSINTEPTFLFLILSGFCMSIGIVIPGISSSVILMCLGVYSNYLQAISTLNINILFPMGIGAILGCFLFLICIRYLLRLCPMQTYYSIIGFVLGSVIILIPTISFSQFYLLLFLPVGVFIAKKLG